MRRREFIDLILDSISDKFDIYHNYWFDNKKFVIYAYSYNKNNRFDSSGLPNYGMLILMSICFSLILMN